MVDGPHEVTADTKEILHASVHREKSLRVRGGCEPVHLSLWRSDPPSLQSLCNLRKRGQPEDPIDPYVYYPAFFASPKVSTVTLTSTTGGGKH